MDDLLTDNDMNSFCSDFVTDKAWDGGMVLATAFGIIVLNFFIRVILSVITVWERSPNVTKEKQKIMTRTFVALFINTALITLIVNAKIDEDLYDIEGILFQGDFEDFTRDWYVKVGSTFTITLFLSVFSPHFLNLLLWFPLGICKRHCCITKF